MMERNRFRPAIVLLLAIACGPAPSTAFAGLKTTCLRSSFSSGSPRTIDTHLRMIGPFGKGKDYDKVVENIMASKGLAREEAEKDYDKYLENPSNYALDKGEQYYKDLGYKSLLDGVVGEAEKAGRGDEVRERIAAFKKKSQIKALSVIGTFLVVFFYYKIQYDLDPTHGL